MARIAIDARPLSAPTTGIGRYTKALMDRLTMSGHDWYLYSHRPLMEGNDWGSNVTVRSGNVQSGSLGSLFAQVVFPFWARRDNVQLFWSPRHHLPLFLSASVASAVTIHDLVWLQFPRTMSRGGFWLERLLMPPSIRKASSVIAVSESTATEILDVFPEHGDKVTTVLEAPFMKVIDTPRVGDYFLFVGTIEPRKNLRRLLKAYAVYSKSVKRPLPLKICGARGWGLPQLQGVCAKFGIEDNVELLGYVPDDGLPVLYSRARALLIPSLYEGFGLPIVEAMSQGTPVITARRGAMMEVAGEGGLLVEPEDCDEMGSAMQRLTEDTDLIEQLQLKAIRRAGQFSWDLAAEQTLAVFEKHLVPSLRSNA